MGQSPPGVSKASCHGCCIALSSVTIHRGQSPSWSTLRSCKPRARSTTSLNLVRRCNSSSTASRNTGSGWVRSSMWSNSGLIEVLTGPGFSHSPLISVVARKPLVCIATFPFYPCRALYVSRTHLTHEALSSGYGRLNGSWDAIKDEMLHTKPRVLLNRHVDRKYSQLYITLEVQDSSNRPATACVTLAPSPLRGRALRPTGHPG